MIRLAFVALLIAVVALGAFVLWPLHDPHPRHLPVHWSLVLDGPTIYPSPGAPPVEDGTIVLRDGFIVAAGKNLAAPQDAQVLRCQRCSVMAGFWNAHVHFTGPQWSNAAFASASRLDDGLTDMLTSHGFTTVVDTGSDLRETVSLRRRIESGDLQGPAIYTAGASLYPPAGIPYYLRDTLPFYLLWLMPQPPTPAAAVRDVERNIQAGADLLKLFTGSWVSKGKVQPMPLAIAKAAAEVAHRHGQLVFSHPSNLAGTEVAIASGVDVLAHAPDDTTGIRRELLQTAVDRHIAMIPTLKMFSTTVSTAPGYLQPIYQEVRTFHELGGQLIFGTDAGYMTDFSTEGEFAGLVQSGLTAQDILRMLTSNPASRFGVSKEQGSIEPGKRADLVVVDGDPATDIGAFSRVRITIRDGRVIYQKGSK